MCYTKSWDGRVGYVSYKGRLVAVSPAELLRWRQRCIPQLLEFAREWIDAGNDDLPVTGVTLCAGTPSFRLLRTSDEFSEFLAYCASQARSCSIDAMVVMTGCYEPGLGAKRRAIYLQMESSIGQYSIMLEWQRLENGSVAWYPAIENIPPEDMPDYLLGLLPRVSPAAGRAGTGGQSTSN